MIRSSLKFLTRVLFALLLVIVFLSQTVMITLTFAPGDAELAFVNGLASISMSVVLLAILGLCRPKRWRWLHDWLFFTVRY